MPSAVSNAISIMVAELQVGLASGGPGSVLLREWVSGKGSLNPGLGRGLGFPGNSGDGNETESPLQATDS